MGISFRKSKKVGNNVKLNASKSGIGISAGVKGARVGVNKKGAYVAGGKDGVYYRKKLGTNNEEEKQEQDMSPVRTIFELIKAIIQIVFYGFILFLLIKFIIMIIKSIIKS